MSAGSSLQGLIASRAVARLHRDHQTRDGLQQLAQRFAKQSHEISTIRTVS